MIVTIGAGCRGTRTFAESMKDVARTAADYERMDFKIG
jgi:hypothetical protein